MRRLGNANAVSILLALAMLLCMLSACGSSETSTTETASESSTEAVVEESDTESAVPAAEDTQEASGEASTAETEESETIEEASKSLEEAEEVTYERTVVSLPLTEETVTFSIWYTWPPVLSAFIDGPGSSPFFVELEERTGVHLDFHTISTETSETEFSLMLTAGDYTDLILNASAFYNNPEQAIEDGLLIDVSGYVDELMPNFKAVFKSDETFERAVYTDNGYIVEMPKFEDSKANNVGPVFRGDWLEQLGMDVPITYEEYHDVLTAFKNELGVTAPMLIPYTGVEDYYSTGYGVPASISGAFYVVDDEVRFTGLEQDYYDFIETMAQWYSEGLIDQDFLSRTTTTDPDTGLIFGDEAGLWSANVLMFDMYTSSATNPDFSIAAASIPVKSDSSGILSESETQVTSGGYNVTTACHNIELALQWIDYWYSEEGSFLANYGLEGVSFDYDENGEPYLLPDILQSPMGLPSSLTLSIYVTGSGPFLEHVSRAYYYFTEPQAEALELWDTSSYDAVSYTYPENATMTVDESTTYSAIMGDIETYMEETVLSILVGQTSVDAFDQMEENLKAMGIEEALEIKQAAYDRYIN